MITIPHPYLYISNYYVLLLAWIHWDKYKYKVKGFHIYLPILTPLFLTFSIPGVSIVFLSSN